VKPLALAGLRPGRLEALKAFPKVWHEWFAKRGQRGQTPFGNALASAIVPLRSRL